MRPGWNWHSADSKRGKAGAGVSVGGAVGIMVGATVAVGGGSGHRMAAEERSPDLDAVVLRRFGKLVHDHRRSAAAHVSEAALQLDPRWKELFPLFSFLLHLFFI